MNLLAEQAETEVERKRDVSLIHGYHYDLVKVRGQLRIRNKLAKQVSVEITKELSGEVIESGPKATDTKNHPLAGPRAPEDLPTAPPVPQCLIMRVMFREPLDSQGPEEHRRRACTKEAMAQPVWEKDAMPPQHQRFLLHFRKG